MMPWLVLLACSGSDNNSYTLPPPTPSEVASKVENTGTVGSEDPQEQAADLPPPVTGSKVTFEGRVEYSGSSTGTIEIEVLHNTIDQTVNLLAQTTLPELGAFTIEVPERPEELTLMAYIDLTGNRISDDDPRGYLTVPNASENQGSLVVTILDLADLEKVKDAMDKK